MQSEKPSLPQIVLDYVDLIIRKMKYSRKVRHDVRAELLTHFEDALRGVENEQDRQKQAEELIREFGDAKLLATLIRRGKKRCRPMWQKAIIRIFQTTCVLFLLLILYIGWFFTGKPQVTTDYVVQLNQLARPVAEDSQNAWPVYQEAIKEYKALEAPDANNFIMSPQKLTGLEDSQRVGIERWISDNQKAIDLICQGNQRSYYWQQYSVENYKQDTYPEMIGVVTPFLREYKNIARLLCWDAYEKAQKGNTEKALNNLIDTYDFGRHLRMARGSAIVEQLVGFAIESMACQCVRDILSDSSVDTDVLAVMQQKYESILAHEKFTVDLQSERLLLYDEIQRCYTYSWTGKEHLYLKRMEKLGPDIEWERLLTLDGIKEGLWILFGHPGRSDTIKSVNELYAMYDELVVMTPAVSKGSISQLQQKAEKVFRENVIIGLLAPSIRRINDYSWELRVNSSATNTIIGALRYKQEKGSYPAGLEALVEAGYLQKIPMDPYSDKPLVYRKTKEGFTLYSVGSNFTDDGGVRGTNNNGKPIDWGQNGDFVFWPVLE